MPVLMSHSSPVDHDAASPDLFRAAADVLIDGLMEKADKRAMALDWATAELRFVPDGDDLKIVLQAEVLL